MWKRNYPCIDLGWKISSVVDVSIPRCHWFHQKVHSEEKKKILTFKETRKSE